MSFAAYAALAGIPAVASIINTLISGRRQNTPSAKTYGYGKKKNKPYVRRPTAYPAKRYGKGKAQFVVDKSGGTGARYQHPWPTEIPGIPGNKIGRLL